MTGCQAGSVRVRRTAVKRTRCNAVWPAVVMAGLFAMAAPAAQQTPSFSADVGIVIVDVQVAASRSRELPAMGTGEFVVKIDGRERRVLFAELLHMDEGPVNPRPMSFGVGSIVNPACIFRFERIVDARNGHYLLGMQRTEADAQRIGGVRVTVRNKDVSVGRWGWRKPVSGEIKAPPAAAPDPGQP